MIRLEHLFEKGEDADFSKPMTINLTEVFRNLPIDKIEERSLDGNELKTENVKNQFRWKTADPEVEGM